MNKEAFYRGMQKRYFEYLQADPRLAQTLYKQAEGEGMGPWGTAALAAGTGAGGLGLGYYLGKRRQKALAEQQALAEQEALMQELYGGQGAMANPYALYYE